MEEKKSIKISLSTFLLIISIIVIIIMACYIFIDKSNTTKEIENLKKDITDKQSIVETLKENDDLNIVNTNNANTSVYNTSISNNVDMNKNSSENNTASSSNKDDITYTIDIRDEIYATIKATKNGKTISKEFEMEAMIDKTGTIDIQNIGKVALVSETGGEYCKVYIYQLMNNEIKLLGDIDCGADMVKEATYTVDTKNEGIAVINAKRNGETITNEFEMSASIANTSVIDIFNYGKVVLVAESGGEYYGIQVYRLSQDYTTGKTKEIKNVGSIQHNM